MEVGLSSKVQNLLCSLYLHKYWRIYFWVLCSKPQTKYPVLGCTGFLFLGPVHKKSWGPILRIWRRFFMFSGSKKIWIYFENTIASTLKSCIIIFDRVHRSGLSMSFSLLPWFWQFLILDKNFLISRFSYFR